ncbi:MAG: AraC family transcriptional regulator, partial [Myxococcota bacterium]
IDSAGVEMGRNLSVARWQDRLEDVPKGRNQAHHIVHLHVRGPKVWRSDPHPKQVFASAGTLSIMPGPTESRWTSDGVVEFIHLYLPDVFVQGVAQAAFETGGRPVDVLERTGVDDQDMCLVAHSVARDLLGGDPPLASELDAWGQVLALKLLRNHSSLSSAKETVRRDQLTPNRLRRLTEYVDVHFAENPSLEVLAQSVGLSPYHLSRAVKNTTGLSPHRLVMRRRIQEVKHLLTATTLPLVEIASMVGFASQSHLTTAFKKESGTTPGRYRRMMHDGGTAESSSGDDD